MFSNVLDVVEFESECDSYTRTFGTLSAGIRTVFRISNLTQLDILCTNALKRYAKSDNSLFMRHPVCVLPRIGRVNGNKKNLPPSNSDRNLVNFLPRRALQQKMYSQDFQEVDHLKRVLIQC